MPDAIMAGGTIPHSPTLSRLGVRSVINASSWLTSLGGSLMAPEVLAAMQEVSVHFVDMAALNRRAGEIVASATGAEAGLVTAGASAALVLQAAACLTGGDAYAASLMPDQLPERREIVIQKAHRNRYDGAWRLGGAVLLEVGIARATAAWELEGAIGSRTAAVAYVEAPFLSQPLRLEQVIEIAHGKGVPVIVDAAAEVPPVSNLRRYAEAGADMVAFSGGKGIGGPQASGMLCGRRDLMDAAWLHALSYDSPHAGIGRPMKASKENIVGLLVALERFLQRDHEADLRRWRAMAAYVAAAVANAPGVRVAWVEEDGRQGPQAIVQLAPGHDPSAIVATLQKGDPPIYIGQGGFRGELYAVMVTLRDGEEAIVAERLRAALAARAE
ncbi:MAG: aminotransferase class V-fold PLP-dependent enzyme [Acetobacteraceae bacterium]|nr:aminotransferase class V-fold PLP-dependent enzyme [Acetobacteraceae bacterium]